MSQETEIPPPGQIRARSEEVQRTSSPTPTDFSTSSAMSSPPSRRLKRTNDEVYRTTTGAPSGHSKNMSINERPRTAPEQKQKTLQPSSFEQNGFPRDIFSQTVQSFSSTSASLGGQPSNVSTAITTTDMQQTFVTRVQELQAQFDHEYDQYEQDLENRDHKAHIEPYDWENLESRYLEEMEPAIKDEQEIQKTIAERYRKMLLWMQTSSDREAHRAIKRLRTRIAFVQNSEAKLTAKELHYEKVLKAFQSTMALLGGP